MATVVGLKNVRDDLSNVEAFNLLVQLLNKEWTKLYRQLLEEKHLYQSLKVDYDGIHKAVREHVLSGYRASFDGSVNQADFRAILEKPSNSGNLKMDPVNVELFCEGPECQRRQAHRCLWSTEIIEQIHLDPNVKPRLLMPKLSQIFVVAYRCESCHRDPQVLIVRRSGWRLSLDGRSPIEEVEVPTYIPDKEKAHYRNAIIAHQTGKTLAALFYLRVFIEQWGRRITGKKGRNTGDEIMAAYAKTLPPGFSDSMPSLKEWYDKLSVPIHDAKDDAEVFSAALDQINQHFEIRAALRLPEVALKPAASSDTDAGGETGGSVGDK